MRALLRETGLPLAAPSANRSGAVSPTTARHVAASLGGKVDLILDGGACSAGIESTIVAVREAGWQVLRPGPITADEIAALLGSAESVELAGGIEAPGQLASHYAPKKPLRLNAAAAEPGEAFLAFGPNPPRSVLASLNLSPVGDLVEAAANLFAYLHRLDASQAHTIAVMPIPDDGIGAAINDRLRRAAAPRP